MAKDTTKTGPASDGSTATHDDKAQPRQDSTVTKLRRIFSHREKAVEASHQIGLHTVYEPENETPVVADFIFIHGIGAGSTSTWSLKHDPAFFWPKEWLARDTEFRGVRIHTYGYDVNAGVRRDTGLNVQAFAEHLMHVLRLTPSIEEADTPIVLIGHSIGGFVMKEAYVRAKLDPTFAHFVNRFRSMYFLGTPSRGSEMTKVLKKLHRVSKSKRVPWVWVLKGQSDVLLALGNDFRIGFSGKELHVFYETLNTPRVGLIVDQNTAPSGHELEILQKLNAHHMELSRFDSINDANYKALRNKLAATVTQIRHEAREALNARENAAHIPHDTMTAIPEEESISNDTQDPVLAISDYLSADPPQSDLLSSLKDARLSGSCSWIVEKPSFASWLDSSNSTRYFWLKGRPGSGKSVLTSHVIDYLKSSTICYYFFKPGGDHTLSRFLLSIACQMARIHPGIRDALHQLAQEGSQMDTHSHSTIWRDIFVNCIFKTSLDQRYFWVIDGLDILDEQGQINDFFSFVSTINTSTPLKVFITSRQTMGLESGFKQLEVVSERITNDDTIGDITRYVEKMSTHFPVSDDEARQDLSQIIISNSCGNFFWAKLVLDQLQKVSAAEEVEEVVETVPSELKEVYLHNLSTINSSSHQRKIAKHIMIWAAFSKRDLTANEIKSAIKLDLGLTLARDLSTSVQSLCGQLVDADQDSHIHLIHETALKFLTDPDLDSEFRLDEQDCHETIAIACLKHLVSEDFTHDAAAKETKKNYLSDYTSLNFFHHINKSRSLSDDLYRMLCELFETNVLFWIENLAHQGALTHLHYTSKNITQFLAHRAETMENTNNNLESWLVDLPRIASQFGRILTEDPSAIHSTVPPFCPRESAIHQKFGRKKGGIELLGSPSVWRDVAAKSGSDESTEQTNGTAETSSTSSDTEANDIKSMYCCGNTGIALYGREGGRVDACDLKDPSGTKCSLFLYKHHRTVTCIDWACKPRIVAFADAQGGFSVMKISLKDTRKWSAETMVDHELGSDHPIHQVLVDQDGNYVLVSSPTIDSIWSITDKKQVATIKTTQRKIWKWFQHPTNPSQLLLLQDRTLKLFNWSDLAEVAVSNPIALPAEIIKHESKEVSSADNIWMSPDHENLVLVREPEPALESSFASSIKVQVISIPSFNPRHIPATLLSRPNHRNSLLSSSFDHSLTPLNEFSGGRRSSIRGALDVPNVETVIGIVKSDNFGLLVFISKEGWVCSIELNDRTEGAPERVKKHFFLPSTWRTESSCLMTSLNDNQDIILVHRGEIMVVRNGLRKVPNEKA